MRFAIEHEKAAIGHDITVAVTGENDQLIARVIIEYDSSQLGDDQLEPPANQYGRSWSKKGLAGPGQQHMVRVLATDSTGKQENAVEKWEG
ncbi:MAG: hypothetical protein ACREAA_01805 [Candidatus Polarisedimenticolia bacterium]